MSGVPYIRFFGDDWLSGTNELSLEERGALITIVAQIAATGRPVRKDIKRLARRFGCTPKATAKVINSLAELKKITIDDELICNERAYKETKISMKNSKKQSEKANQRWSKNKEKHNKNKGDYDAAAQPWQCQPEPEPEPIEKNIQKRFEEFWEVFADKRGKEGALRVWNRKHLERKADEVIRGASAYVKIRGDDKKFWKQAQGWLNDGRWADENLKPKPKVERTVFGDIPDNTFMSPEEIQRKAGMIQ